MTTPIHWMQPAGSAPVSFWILYQDSQWIGGVLLPGRVVAFLSPTPQPDGTYRAAVELGDQWHAYTLTAINSGGESLHSNRMVLPEPSLGWTLPPLLLALWLVWRLRR